MNEDVLTPTYEETCRGWAKARLEEILPLSYGKGLSKSSRVETGSIPVYGSSGVIGFHNESLVCKSSVIVGRKGTVGTVHLNKGPSWPIDTTYYVDATASTNLSFFFHLLTFLDLGKLDRSTAIPGLSRSDYNDIEVLVPPLPEQHRIVAEIEKQFTRLDASVAALKRVQANLKRYRASVLKAACEGTLVATEAELARAEGRDYEPASFLLERILAERHARWETQENRHGKYKEPVASDSTDLPELPEGWVWSSIGNIFEVYVGSTPRRARSDFWNGDIPWVSSGEVSFSRIKATRECMTEAGLKNSSVTLHPKGTVLLGMIGEGKTRGQVSILDIPACNSQNSAAIRVSESELPPEYVFYYLWGQYDATRRIGSGNNQPALNKSRVQELLIPLPPIAEQHRIVAEVERRLSVIQQAESTVEANLTRAERLCQSILKQAFSGNLVPQDPNDEPVSVLLERIRAERESAEAAAKSQRNPRRRRSKPNATISPNLSEAAR